MRLLKFMLLLQAILVSCFLKAQSIDSDTCLICKGQHTISAIRKDSTYFLLVDNDRIKIGKKLKMESAEGMFRASLNNKLRAIWNQKSASGYTAYLNKFIRTSVDSLFRPAFPAPELIDSIQISPSIYVGLVKDINKYFLISIYRDTQEPVDVFTHTCNGYQFSLCTIAKDPNLWCTLPAILFLKNKIAGISRPTLVVQKEKEPESQDDLVTAKSTDTDILFVLQSDGKKENTMIPVNRELDIALEQAFLVGPFYRRHLVNSRSYIDRIRQKLLFNCEGCELSSNETLLIYDHECQKFLYKPFGTQELHEIEDLNKVHVRYKRPVRVEVVNFNRYIYNLNLASSDISLTSQESTLMQQYLLPGSTNGQASSTNTYTNSGSSNGADFVFLSIANFKANIDLILNKITSIGAPILHTGWLDTAAKMVADKNFLGKIGKKDPGEIDFAISFARSLSNSQTLKAVDTSQESFRETFNSLRTLVSNVPELAPDFRKFYDSVDKAKARQAYLANVRKLKEDFYRFREYCDSFIDNRILAYSICTQTLPCCESALLTYQHFESLLSAISNQIPRFKAARSRYKELSKPIPTKESSHNSPSTAKPTKPEPIQKKDITTSIILDVSAADALSKDGKITGLDLHLVSDTTKAKTGDEADPADQIDTLWFALEKSIPNDYIMRQIIFRNNLLQSNMSYTSPPIFPYGDRLGLVLQMPVADTVKRMGTMPATTTTFSADIPVFGRPLFSFSAGSFIGLGVRKPTAEWQQVPTQGSNIVQSSSPYKLAYTGPGSYPAGLDGMGNITWRLGCFRGSNWITNNVWLGISGGVGVVVDQPSVRLGYMLGGTLSLGTYQQFHITAGAIAMNVNVLKDNLSFSESYQTQPAIQPYNQKLQLGWFASVTYTIFSPKSTGTIQNQVINAN